MTRRIRSTALHYFTLIELLVVIAIIALLAAILLPALRKSIKEAREVVCMNNIHQLGVAATTYKEDYYGDYPPPVVWWHPTLLKVHPHDLKASDIAFIAPYIGEDRPFDDSTPLEEGQYPAVIRCPFSKFSVSGPPGYYYYTLGYAYFGNLEWLPPGYSSETSLPDEFKLKYGSRKYASRNCDPDAALWGDSVSYSTYNLPTPAGFIHTKSGRETNFWHDVNFADFDRQNMGSVDGSVKIRWWWEVNPDSSGVGAGLQMHGRYFWWYY